MKISATLLLTTLAVAVFATDATNAEPIHARDRPVMKKVALAKKAPLKLVASDLNEGDEIPNNGDVVEDPFVGNPFGFDEEEPPTTAPQIAVDSGSGSSEADGWNGSNSGSGDNEDASLDSSAANEESSLDGSAANEESSLDGSAANEESSSNGSGENEDGSGVDSEPPSPPAAKGAYEAAEVEAWGLFDQVSSADGSGGSNEEDESSGSGSNAEETEGSGSTGSNGSGPDEALPEEPIGGVQGWDDLDELKGGNHGWGDVTGAGETKAMRAATKHHMALAAKAAGKELATRASAENTSPFNFKDSKTLMMAGSAVGAAVGALAVVLGVMRLRRQQQHDEQSTLAAELPEPQTGREDFEAVATTGPEVDELASSSVDLEEALTEESAREEEEDAEEGAFANGSVVV